MKQLIADYYSRPIEIVDGEGCELIDRKGKRYLDFIGGWCVSTVGWKHTEIIRAVHEAMQKTPAIPPMLRDATQEKFAEILLNHAPGKLARVFRCTSGSEAVEFALKCARATTRKPTIVSIDGVYHGHTYGAASVGDACRELMGPCLPGFLKLPMPNAYRGVAGENVIQQFEKLLNERNDIAAFLSEPVWTNGGVVIPPPDFYPKIQELCRQHGVLFIMDEVATCCGRCGVWLASELWGLTPDILCLGKGITGGYGTLGATLVTEEVFERSRGIPAYSTFGWLVTDRAAAQTNVELVLKQKLWENANRVGTLLLEQLRPLEKRPYVGQVRGIGLLVGIEIVKDTQSRERDIQRAVEFCNRCAEAGLLLETADNVLFMSPPLILSEDEARHGAEILNNVVGS